MKEVIAKSLSDTTYVAAGMLVCGLAFCILNDGYTVTKQNALYLLAILASYFVINLMLQLITKTTKKSSSNGNT